MTEQINEATGVEIPKKERLASPNQAFAEYSLMTGPANVINPWSPSDIDKMEAPDILKNYRDVVKACRFFYKKDPLASTVINKMVDIGINGIKISRNGISDSEYKIYEAIEDKLLDFSESMALEFLLSGLVIPEIKYAPMGKDELNLLGIKRYSTLTLPVSMWVRDPMSIIVNQTMLSDKPSFVLEIPKELIYFITHEGKYADGTEDKKLYAELSAYYPVFIAAIRGGATTYPIDNPYAIRRRFSSESPYPLPFLYPAIEAMKHKRNLRRMDYSIASRVISAIQLIRLGSDLFPVTEQDQSQFDDIRQQMFWRNGSIRDIERVFQLFGNHTLQIDWVTPPVDALLNDAKYLDINEDIIFAMGFPRILMTGETAKSNTSDAQFASVAPVKTMENFRRKITTVLQGIINEIASRNKFKTVPEIEFEPLQLVDFKIFVEAVSKLYDTGNLSRESFSDIFGFTWEDEMENKKNEQKVLVDSKLPEFAPQAFSPQAGPAGQGGTPATPGKPAGPNNQPKPNSNPNVKPAPAKPAPKPAAK
jgi:hypothetical protein